MLLSKAVDNLFDHFDAQFLKNGWIATGWQIWDATLVAAPKQRNNNNETRLVLQGETANEI